MLESVQALPNLPHLELHKALDRNEMRFEDGWFQKLKTLRLEDLQSLRLGGGEEECNALSGELTHSSVFSLKNLSWGIENLAKLKHLELSKLAANVIVSQSR